MKTVKRLIHKVKASGQDPYLALLDHRKTLSQGLDSSPAQRLLSPRTGTLLPAKSSLLLPRVIQAEQALLNNQMRQWNYYNRSAKDLDALQPGDCVRVQPFEPHTQWRLGKMKEAVYSRSYETEMDSGAVLRRNCRHLRHAHGVPQTGPVDIENVDQQDTRTEDQPSQPNTQSDTYKSNASVTTRSGRVVRKPQRYKDFTT